MPSKRTNHQKAVERYKKRLIESGLIAIHRYVTPEQKIILDAVLKCLRNSQDVTLPKENRSFLLEAKLKDFLPNQIS